MRFKIFSILSTSFCVVVADYNLWFRTCTSGVGEGSTWSQAVASTDRDGQCGGCGTWGDVGGGEARGGNPCNTKCKDDLIYRWKGNYYDIVVASTGIKVGHCYRERGQASCAEWNFSCAVTKLYRCITYYCNLPAKRERPDTEASGADGTTNTTTTGGEVMAVCL